MATDKNANTASSSTASISQAPPSWISRDFPGAANADEVHEAFKIVNEWAKALQEWEIRVRAMSGILEAMLDLSSAQFESVVHSIKNHRHSKQDIRDALKTAGGGGVGGGSDVVGSPPDPPFRDDSF